MSPLFLAVDIGNSFIHLSHFSSDSLPAATSDGIHKLDRVDELEGLGRWLAPEGSSETLTWFVASVHRGRERQLHDWIQARRPGDSYHLLSHTDFRLQTLVRNPERVGKDRLAAAVAANRRRCGNHGAIIVDAGTAITVDYVDSGGVFHGGAILPSPRIAARALSDFTDALPFVDLPTEIPPAVGMDTVAALRSGLYWGALGGVRELISQITAQATHPVDLFLTGGGADPECFLSSLEGERVPHLTLDGVALTGLRILQDA